MASSSPLSGAVSPALQKAVAAHHRAYDEQLRQISSLEHALRDGCDSRAALAAAAKTTQRALSKEQKEYGKALNGLGKAIDRAFPEPPAGAAAGAGGAVGERPVPPEMDRGLINRAIALHLYRSGRFQLAEAFVADAGGLGLGADDKAPFVELFVIADELRRRNLAPALEWAAKALPGTRLHFHLVRARYLHLLRGDGGGGNDGNGGGGGGGSGGTGGDTAAALAYVRATLPAFWAAPGFAGEIRELIGLLAFIGTGAAALPRRYARLLDDAEVWGGLVPEFSRAYCAAAGLALESPLHTALTVGARALPVLEKMGSVMPGRDWTAVDVLPVEIDVGGGATFHSIFACPVSREVATAENPPVMLPCGHAVSKESVARLARGGSRFKCAYCPSEASVSACRILYF